MRQQRRQLRDINSHIGFVVSEAAPRLPLRFASCKRVIRMKQKPRMLCHAVDVPMVVTRILGFYRTVGAPSTITRNAVGTGAVQWASVALSKGSGAVAL